MHPFYGELREALAEHKYSDDHQREILELNLKRARVLPAGKERYVLVNAAQQRLFMYENGKAVDSMVVVVGKTKYPTPMLAAYIRYAALNPYWYVPPDLAWDDVGQFVEKQGFSYFEKMGYEQVSDWSKNPQVLDATKIDWDSVRDGKTEILLRQKPGPENFMGRIKFMFPNQFGVYLHDNPRRELFEKSVRYFSGGCVRLEDAWRLSRWLFHRELTWEGAGTEEPVPLDQPVPVYITYMTAVPDGQAIAYYDDAYGRDKAKLAGSDGGDGGSTAPQRAADARSAPGPDRDPGDVLRDGPPGGVARGAEPDILDEQLAHQRVGGGIAAAANDAAVGQRAVGTHPDGDRNAPRSDSRRGEAPVFAVGDFGELARGRVVPATAAARAGSAAARPGPGAGRPGSRRRGASAAGDLRGRNGGRGGDPRGRRDDRGRLRFLRGCSLQAPFRRRRASLAGAGPAAEGAAAGD